MVMSKCVLALKFGYLFVVGHVLVVLEPVLYNACLATGASWKGLAAAELQ